MNENKPTRSIWSYILPYLLIAVTVILIVWFAFANLIGGSTGLYLSDLPTYLRVNDATSTSWNKDAMYVSKVEAKQSYQMTTVSFDAVFCNTKNKTTSYTVTMDNKDWDTNQFSAYMYGESTEATPDAAAATKLVTWKELFADRVAEWNNHADLTKIKSHATLEIKNGFEVSFWSQWGPTILLLAGTAILCIFFFSRINGSVNGSNNQAMNFNKSPARREDTSKIRFSDVAGCDEEKAEMVELVEYLKNPKKYSKYGARLPKGVLLIGNPGTGKTLLAKAVAGEAGTPFFSISGSDFVEMFVGVGAGRVRDLFKRAKQSAPCIIFIDEIDAVGRQRGAGLGGGNDEREQTLNQLLVEMDGFDYNAGILVIAATNRDDVLDPALLRPGRFDRIITVGLPDANGREAIFKVHARNKKIDPSVDFKALSKRTVGFSGADIENILNEAAILAVRFNKETVGMAEIDEAIDRRIAGPAKSGKGMNDQERKEVAYHEAGHAVIGLTLPYSEKVQKITIIPRGKTGGHVLMTPEDDRFLLTKKELIAQITGLLGGRSSEEIFFDDISTGASNDIQEATKLARMMVTEFGMSDLGPIQYEQNSGSVFLGRDYTNTQKNFSSEVAFEIDKAVREIVDEAHKQAIEILTTHKNEVTLIAETLLEKETITAEEIEVLVKTGKLPEKTIETIHETQKETVEEAKVIEGKVSPEEQIKAETVAPVAPESKEEPKESKPKKKVIKKKPAKKVDTKKDDK